MSPARISLLLLAAAFTGCGDDVLDDGERADGGARDAEVRSDSGGKGGKGAKGGSGAAGRPAAGSGGRGGSGDAGRAAPEVHCGETMCEAPPDVFTRACCADEETSTCGLSILGGRCIEPPADGGSCPAVDFAGIFSFPSCCTPRGMCGIDASSVGIPGCMDLATAAERARMAGATFAFPSPRTCDEAVDPGEPDHSDAGATDDAGV